jgi:hypothetical protein
MAADVRTGTVENPFESICEAGVALIEDRGMPRRDLEAAVSGLGQATGRTDLRRLSIPAWLYVCPGLNCIHYPVGDQ